jgi:hypothetical protein
MLGTCERRNVHFTNGIELASTEGIICEEYIDNKKDISAKVCRPCHGPGD